MMDAIITDDLNTVYVGNNVSYRLIGFQVIDHRTKPRYKYTFKCLDEWAQLKELELIFDEKRTDLHPNKIYLTTINIEQESK